MTTELVFTLESLASDINNWFDQQEQLDTYCDHQNTLVRPEPPMIVESMEDWEKYDKKVEAYEEEKRRFSQLIYEARTRIENTKSIMREMLPGNVWFKVETKRGPRWIGNETSNWPGDRGTLFLQDEEPSHRLQHRIIND
jgi:predicted RNase H-like nuclease (RuvC/YqgF family)